DSSGFSSKFIDFLKKDKSFSPYQHQIEAWDIINSGKDCVVSTGTGSGKTESFLFPIIDKCLSSNNKNINSIIIYPLKALANDQGQRVGKLLDEVNGKFGTTLTYAIFDGDTPESESDRKKGGARIPSGNKSEICTREEIFQNPPNILLTNYVMLERIILQTKYSRLLQSMHPEIITLDELHYYRGSQGIDVSLLLRRFSYLLNKINGVKDIQWIGTSATLGDKNSKEIYDFLSRLFDRHFTKEQIVTPSYNKLYSENILSEPVFLKEVNDKSIEYNRLRGHAFFCSPPTFYRCLECGKIHHKETTVCEGCASNLIFKISTCRQCGEEYFIYNADGDSFRSNFTFSKIKRENIKLFNETSKKKTEFILSKSELKNSKKLKICQNCLSLLDESSICNCGCSKGFKVFSVDNEKEATFKEGDNNSKYCPCCDSRESRMQLIVSTSKLSDANCSHIIFNELFMVLPDDNKKLLIFTDNVQRSSKFARELEETHLKNIARSALERYIAYMGKDKPLDLLISEIIRGMRMNRFSLELKNSIEKEIYEEILGSGNKVASLANRSLFDLNFDLKFSSEDERMKFTKVFNILKKYNHVRGYYNVMNDSIESLIYSKVKKREDLIDCIHKELGGEDILSTKTLLQDWISKEYLIEENENIFLDEMIIYLKKSETTIDAKNNYYSDWSKIENIPFIHAEVDNGKNDAEERSQREENFKNNSNKLNVLVATPTLELGIDIGGLDVIGLLYSPPSPAQYSQRVGRAGRAGKSSLSVSYMSKSTLDRMYYFEPERLVEGKISPPQFLLSLESPIKKSLFSLFLYYLLNETDFRQLFEKEGAWKQPLSWEFKIEEICKIFIKSEKDFFNYYKDFFSSNGIYNKNFESLVGGWCDKLKSFVVAQKSMKSTSQRDYNIFSYLQKAGLLPDYAFGSGGAMLTIQTPIGPKNIHGYSLKNLCPPSTLDHNKMKYKTTKVDISQYNGSAKKILSGYKECSECHIFCSQETLNCPLCSVGLSPGKKIVEPKRMWGKRTSFSSNPTRAIPTYSIFSDVLEGKDEKNGIMSPIDDKIYTIFTHKINNFGIDTLEFSEDGEMLDKKTKGKKRWEGVIGEEFRTRLLVLDPRILGGFFPNKTFLNALISAMEIVAGCEDGEISGELLGDNSGKILLFDNVEGGVGYVDLLYNDPEKVLMEIKKLCERECCESGCPSCVGSYWRQYELGALDKQGLLGEINEYFKLEQKGLKKSQT
ncbi:MAG: DEAD/DEAH box helicase, partial [Bacteroidales bacterium]|nr:DEAD/DEAH box helicase [Bacteroidales bacterium]